VLLLTAQVDKEVSRPNAPTSALSRAEMFTQICDTLHQKGEVKSTLPVTNTTKEKANPMVEIMQLISRSESASDERETFRSRGNPRCDTSPPLLGGEDNEPLPPWLQTKSHGGHGHNSSSNPNNPLPMTKCNTPPDFLLSGHGNHRGQGSSTAMHSPRTDSHGRKLYGNPRQNGVPNSQGTRGSSHGRARNFNYQGNRGQSSPYSQPFRGQTSQFGRGFTDHNQGRSVNNPRGRGNFSLPTDHAQNEDNSRPWSSSGRLHLDLNDPPRNRGEENPASPQLGLQLPNYHRNLLD
jgi:hypothetical protein